MGNRPLHDTGHQTGRVAEANQVRAPWSLVSGNKILLRREDNTSDNQLAGSS